MAVGYVESYQLMKELGLESQVPAGVGGAGVPSEWLGTLAVLPKDLDSSSTHWLTL